MNTEDEIRKVLHPEAYKTMEFNPRPRMPLGCDQQGRYPQAAEPCIDLDELGVREPPPPEPWWHDVVLLAVGVGVVLMVAIFAPIGGVK